MRGHDIITCCPLHVRLQYNVCNVPTILQPVCVAALFVVVVIQYTTMQDAILLQSGAELMLL